MPDTNSAQYKKLVDDLPGSQLTRPPSGSSAAAPQFNDGTTHVRSTPTDEQAAEAYVTGDDYSATEEWVVFDESAYLGRTLRNNALGGSGTLTAARLAELQAQQTATGKKYLYTKYVAPYTQLPSTDAIAPLPDTNVAGVTTYVYDVLCTNGTTGETTLAGQMFRERLVSASKKVSYTDHWVFWESYYTPRASDTVTFAPNTAQDRPTTLKRFLSIQRAKYDASSLDAQVKWRYSQIPYSFGPLPNKV